MIHRLSWAICFACLAVPAGGQERLFSEDQGVELHGSERLVAPASGTCNVLETDTRYEEIKQNDGALMDVWRLDFEVEWASRRPRASSRDPWTLETPRSFLLA